MTKIKTVKRGGGHGEIVYIGDTKTEEITLQLMSYNEKRLDEKEVSYAEEKFPFNKKSKVTWLNVIGIHNTELIEKIGKQAGIHHLVLEDVANTTQRPKIEEYDNYMFIVLKMLFYDENSNEMHFEQVSLIVGKNYVISFQEKEGDVFDIVRERIRQGKGKIRKMKSDYLAYCLIDAIVDNYFPILDKISDNVEEIEKELVKEPAPKTLHDVHSLKRELILLHKSVWPLRDVISMALRNESSIIQKNTKIYFGNVYDHTIQVIENIETFRDLIAGIHETYLSLVSNRLNEIMKVLTMISTIFIPLTFITGVYGMNFIHMPEIGLRWTYPAVWIVMIAAGISMMIFFKKKKWL